MNRSKDPQYAQRLFSFYDITLEDAQKLVAAGIKTPGQINRATKAAIREAAGARVLRKVRG